MADSLTPSERSERMSRIRQRDTRPEMTVRRLVHGMGYRYRLHRRDLPGCPDLVFPARRKAIFVHGCFWHWHPDPACPIAKMPKSRIDFWSPKLRRNRARDERKAVELRSAGWNVLVIWECELKKKDRKKLAEKIAIFLKVGLS